jgi:hydrogenase expression/formation protein HypD
MKNEELISIISKISSKLDRTVNLMEVCGTHTARIFKYGIKSLLPSNIRLISGPGCPVCVTPIIDIDRAIEIAMNKNIILCTFGDMMRVFGSKKSLELARSEGADIRIVYSPYECLKIAQQNSNKDIVFFSAGFETTAPAVAATLEEARLKGINNFFIYSVHKLIPPAIKLLLKSKDTSIDGFLLPGHVSVIIGSEPYNFISEKYLKPSVITGFEAEDILSAIAMLLLQIKNSISTVEIQYKVVSKRGNRKAIDLMNKYFEVRDSYWRGIGVIKDSGLKLKKDWAHRDIEQRYDITIEDVKEPAGCQCGYILKGIKTPLECPLFGKKCRPEHPIGACMVSSEGSCSVYYKYREL